ncbi:hypothetical protein HPB47_005700 [Ixodes persulcatus]|uniref:Uncharacterized protein n=1 Tax=Ixodes persulcatus TaxID=34615 RepID=A0AC60PC98_IXOPE|nr:hypothetical protein HPB47_005700 [Ixodes persulcatus]
MRPEFVPECAREHQHDEEEIRMIGEGGGFFDIRDLQDSWVRIQVQAGDLIVLPPKAYHRFMPKANNCNMADLPELQRRLLQRSRLLGFEPWSDSPLRQTRDRSSSDSDSSGDLSGDGIDCEGTACAGSRHRYTNQTTSRARASPDHQPPEPDRLGHTGCKPKKQLVCRLLDDNATRRGAEGTVETLTSVRETRNEQQARIKELSTANDKLQAHVERLIQAVSLTKASDVPDDTATALSNCPTVQRLEPSNIPARPTPTQSNIITLEVPLRTSTPHENNTKSPISLG